jgi:hypothetical protein
MKAGAIGKNLAPVRRNWQKAHAGDKSFGENATDKMKGRTENANMKMRSKD